MTTGTGTFPATQGFDRLNASPSQNEILARHGTVNSDKALGSSAKAVWNFQVGHVLASEVPQRVLIVGRTQ
jgi:hypothetical protein